MMTSHHSPFETFLASSSGRRVVVERIVRRLDDIEQLFVASTCRALRECVTSARGEAGARALRRPKLFPDARRVDPTTPIDPDDPCERLWVKIARGTCARYGLTMDATTMVDTIRNPPSGRGDAVVELRIRYLRRLGCAWDARVTEACLEQRPSFVSTWRWCVENGCPVNPRPMREQTWLLDRGVEPETFFGKELPDEFSGEGEFFRELTLDDENRVVFADDGAPLYPYEEEDAATERALERVATMMESATNEDAFARAMRELEGLRVRRK